jgi:predicted porin
MMPKKIGLLTIMLALSWVQVGWGQSQIVQAYGLLDVGVSHLTGLPSGGRHAVVSGIMEGSRLGLRGQENWTPGYKTIFLMEHRVEADTGAFSVRPPSGSKLPDRLSSAARLGLPAALQPVVNTVRPLIGTQIGTNVSNAFWDRQIYAGLITPVGGILLGRQYTPAYEVSAAVDTLNTQSSLASGQVATFPPAIDIRADNAIAYRLQQGPLSGSLMWALGEDSAAAGRLLGGHLMFRADAWSAALGYNTRNNELGQKSLTSGLAGGSLKVGPGWLFASVASIKDDHPSGLSVVSVQLTPVLGQTTARLVQNAYLQALRQDARMFHLGYRWMLKGKHTFYVASTRYDDHRPAQADVTSWGGAYTYALSKRSDINLVLARFNNRYAGQTAPGQAGFVGGVLDQEGRGSSSFSVGMRHRF